MKSIAFGLVLPLLAAYSAAACSEPPPPARHHTTVKATSGALATFASSDATSADLGVTQWRMRTEKGVAVLEGLSSSKKVMGHVTVRQVKESASKKVTTSIWWANANKTNTGIIKMRSDKTLLANDMPALMTVWADHAQKDLAAYSKQSKQEYGCVGDILWTIGGALAAIGTCASVPLTNVLGALACGGTIIAGPVAGAVSAWEDCGGSSSSSSGATNQASDGNSASAAADSPEGAGGTEAGGAAAGGDQESGAAAGGNGEETGGAAADGDKETGGGAPEETGDGAGTENAAATDADPIDV